MRALGAEVHEHGRDFDEAREFVEALAAREGWRYVHNANEPHLIAGVATYAVEVFEELPDVEYIFVPIGGGSGAAGCAIVRRRVGSRAKVIGVQANGADAFARSWRGPYAWPATRGDVCRGDRDPNHLRPDVHDAQVSAGRRRDAGGVGAREGLSAAIGCTHNLAEGAGAAALAAAGKAQLPAGAKVVCVMSGGNADQRTLQRVACVTVSESVSMGEVGGIDPEEDHLMRRLLPTLLLLLLSSPPSSLPRR